MSFVKNLKYFLSACPLAVGRRLVFSGLLVITGFAVVPAQANIYSFTDDKGVVHFSNLPHLDKRYRLVYRIPTDVSLRRRRLILQSTYPSSIARLKRTGLIRNWFMPSFARSLVITPMRFRQKVRWV
jgi:hypothetical protein